MNKKKVLFVYSDMVIGGSTTSLLSILTRLDYNKYDVDLLLFFHNGELLNLVPEEVNLLPPAMKYQNKWQEYIHRFCSPKYIYHFLKSKQIEKQTGIPMRAAQYMGTHDAYFCRDISTEYDVAISFLEGRCCKYLSRHVKAKKKIAWIHINLIDAQYDPKYERESLSAMDEVVFVSEDCKTAFDECFPELSNRSTVVENILSTEYVRSRGNEKTEINVDSQMINLVTICRITFDSKALDRAIAAIKRTKIQEKNHFSLKWYIIGDGSDYKLLKQLIHDNELQNDVVLLGGKTNPYPYMKDMSMFFLPSRREGKPMVVTEAFMMGLPALVTEYSSAREQVRDGVDGIVVENSEQGVYEGLLRIIEHPEIIEELKKNVVNTDYSNVEEMEKVVQLIEG